jgi:hypothetical protein
MLTFLMDTDRLVSLTVNALVVVLLLIWTVVMPLYVVRSLRQLKRAVGWLAQVHGADPAHLDRAGRKVVPLQRRRG